MSDKVTLKVSESAVREAAKRGWAGPYPSFHTACKALFPRTEYEIEIPRAEAQKLADKLDAFGKQTEIKEAAKKALAITFKVKDLYFFLENFNSGDSIVIVDNEGQKYDLTGLGGLERFEVELKVEPNDD